MLSHVSMRLSLIAPLTVSGRCVGEVFDLLSATGHQLNWGCGATQSSGVGVEGGQGIYRATTGSLYLRHKSWSGIDQVKDRELDDCRTEYLYYEALSPYHGPRGAPLLLFHKAWEYVL